MTGKRLRLSPSSSNFLTGSTTSGSSNPRPDAQPRGKAMKVSPAENKAILQVSAPSPGTNKESVEKEKFFEKCFNCGKKIGEADMVFMYSYLRAFCCEDCRDDQMEQDRRFGSSS